MKDEELMVLSFSTVDRMPALLTAAEEEIARALLAGRSNAEIAALRSTSVRTVANQVASIFRKLGCASRAELAYKLGR